MLEVAENIFIGDNSSSIDSQWAGISSHLSYHFRTEGRQRYNPVLSRIDIETGIVFAKIGKMPWRHLFFAFRKGQKLPSPIYLDKTSGCLTVIVSDYLKRPCVDSGLNYFFWESADVSAQLPLFGIARGLQLTKSDYDNPERQGRIDENSKRGTARPGVYALIMVPIFIVCGFVFGDKGTKFLRQNSDAYCLLSIGSFSIAVPLFIF